MATIFKNAKFGDRFKTRDGRTAIYLGYNRFGIKFWHQLVLKNKPDIDTQINIKTYDNDGIYWSAPKDSKYCDDIVSRWKEHDGVLHSIEERARQAETEYVGGDETIACSRFYDGYIKGAIEQDRIARAEERERCIKEAQDAHCKLCKYYDGIGNVCTSFYECNEREMIRKALEGGEG